MGGQSYYPLGIKLEKLGADLRVPHFPPLGQWVYRGKLHMVCYFCNHALHVFCYFCALLLLRSFATFTPFISGDTLGGFLYENIIEG